MRLPGRRWFWGIPAVLLLTAAGWRLLAPREEALFYDIHAGRFDILVDATGEVFAEKSISVSAPPVRWRLQVIWLIKEGTVVKRGDLLVRFDPGELQKEMSDKEAELKGIKAEIRQKTAELKALENDYAMQLLSAQLDYDMAKVQIVEDEGLIARKDIEQAKLKLQNAKDRLDQTRQKLEAERQSSLAQNQMLEVKEKNAQSQYDFVLDSLKKMEVLAPAPGLVVIGEIWKGEEQGKIQVGDNVYPGYSVIALPDFQTLQVRIWASEVDAGRLKAGQPASVALDAFPDLKLPARVKSVASVGAKRSYESPKKEFEVILELGRRDARLKPGMTARGSVTVDSFPGVLSIPIESVKTSEEGTFVYVRRGWGTRKQAITLGERNTTHIRVTRGVAEGDRILLLPPDKGDPR